MIWVYVLQSFYPFQLLLLKELIHIASWGHFLLNTEISNKWNYDLGNFSWMVIKKIFGINLPYWMWELHDKLEHSIG